LGALGALGALGHRFFFVFIFGFFRACAGFLNKSLVFFCFVFCSCARLVYLVVCIFLGACAVSVNIACLKPAQAPKKQGKHMTF
jgi:hypothetical protein